MLVTPALERDRPASVGAPEADQLKTQQSWDKYVANKLSGGKDGASQEELICTLQRELTQPGRRCESVSQGQCTFCNMHCHVIVKGTSYAPSCLLCIHSYHDTLRRGSSCHWTGVSNALGCTSMS